jgi:hypothetical protein
LSTENVDRALLSELGFQKFSSFLGFLAVLVHEDMDKLPWQGGT